MRVTWSVLETYLRGLDVRPRAILAVSGHWEIDAPTITDHLLPLMVVAGAASGEPGRVHFHDHALGKPISGFRFG